MRINKSRILRYIGDYKFNSIFIKNLTLMLLLLVIPLSVITFVSYSTYNKILENEISTANINSVTKVKDVMEMIIKECGSQINWVTFDTDVELFMHRKAEETIVYYDLYKIKKLINMHLLTKDYFDSIYIYAERSRQLMTFEGSKELNTFSDSEWYPSYEANVGNKDLWIIARSKQTGISKESIAVVSLCKWVHYGPESNGAIIFNLDMKKIGTIINSTLGKQDENIVIVDENDIILYNHGNSMVGRYLNEILSADTIKAMKDKQSYMDDNSNNKQILTSVRSDKNGWKYISFVPISVYSGRINALKNIMLIVVIFSTLFTIAISLVISINTYNPIRKILSFIEQPQTFHFTENDKDGNKDEIRYIVTSFAKTMDQNRVIGEELETRVELLKKAQAVALQSQINPHFFYNTLETINWMAIRLFNGKNDVSKMLGSLSSMLRLSLENTDKLIPFSTEREHAGTYIEIQKIRYDNSFDVIWNINEDVSCCKVIKITLQPIIENAIYHGIKPLGNDGIINITAYIADESLHIIVKDNGVGMLKEDTERLNALMRDEYIKENEHLGLMNVNQRLKLFFGDSYGIHVESVPNSGTSIDIRMPVIK